MRRRARGVMNKWRIVRAQRFIRQLFITGMNN